jgi:hypothetical protein
MDSRNHDAFANLEQQLRSSADAARPAFSPELHERILAAVDDCEMLPLQSWTSRLRQPLALAASLLAIIAGGLLAGSSLSGSRDGATQRGAGGRISAGSLSPPSNRLVANDPDLMQRALAAADHWGWLDEDARSAAAWFVADLPLDLDSSDAAVSQDEDEAEVGS